MVAWNRVVLEPTESGLLASGKFIDSRPPRGCRDGYASASIAPSRFLRWFAINHQIDSSGRGDALLVHRCDIALVRLWNKYDSAGLLLL